MPHRCLKIYNESKHAGSSETVHIAQRCTAFSRQFSLGCSFLESTDFQAQHPGHKPDLHQWRLLPELLQKVHFVLVLSDTESRVPRSIPPRLLLAPHSCWSHACLPHLSGI